VRQRHVVSGRPLLAATLVLVAVAAPLAAAHEQGPPPWASSPTLVGAIAVQSAQPPLVKRRAAPLLQQGGRGVAHLPGGRPLPHSDPPLSVTLSYTGVWGVEPTLGIQQDGTVLTQGAVRRNVDEYDLGQQPVVLRSRDGGSSWSDVSPETHLATQDPYLHVDPVTDRVFTTDWNVCTQLSSSDDAGKQWQPSAPVCGEVMDHQTLFTGPPAQSPTLGYPNVVYLCGISYGLLTPTSAGTQCTKSLDGGATFVVTGEPAFLAGPGNEAGSFGIPGACSGASGHGHVAPDGTVLVPKGHCGVPMLAASRDEGLTWTRSVVSDKGMARQSDGTPDHEAAVVAAADGTLHYLWVAHNRLPYLATSHDGGATWTSALMVAPPGVNETVLPALAIGPRGELAAAYMGTTSSPGAPFDRAAYGDTSWTAYVTLIERPAARMPRLLSAPLTEEANPLINGTCGPFRCQAVFDFIDVQFAPEGTAWASVVDGCGDGLYALNGPDERGCYQLGELVVARVQRPARGDGGRS
jgi:hypothetical protein